MPNDEDTRMHAAQNPQTMTSKNIRNKKLQRQQKDQEDETPKKGAKSRSKNRKTQTGADRAKKQPKRMRT